MFLLEQVGDDIAAGGQAHGVALNLGDQPFRDKVMMVGVAEPASGRREAARPAPGTAESASDHVASARLALGAGRYADAVVAAARAVRADPLLVDPHLVAGEALVNLGRDADAVRELRQAVYLQADCAPAHLLLAGHFLRKYAEENAKKIDGYSDDALERLAAYNWPGNVRELENVVERAVVLAQGNKVTAAELPPNVVPAKGRAGLQIPGATMDEIERYAITKTLESTGGSTRPAWNGTPGRRSPW